MNAPRPLSRPWRLASALMDALAMVAAMALAAMVAVTCLDVLLRRAGSAFTGAYDVARLCGAVALACALPATTAAKGHIAIEYFFHKLKRRGRRVVDVLVHGGMVAAFAAAAWRCVGAGRTYWLTGEVTPTLQLRLFWVPWVMAAGCALAAVASLFHLLHPGRELTRT